MGQNKAAADYLDNWQKDHPGQQVPQDVYERAASISPNTPRVQAVGKSLEVARAQQGQDIQAQGQAASLLAAQLKAGTIDEPTYNAKMQFLYQQSPYAKKLDQVTAPAKTDAVVDTDGKPVPTPADKTGGQKPPTTVSVEDFIKANNTGIERGEGKTNAQSSATGPGQQLKGTLQGVHDKYNFSAPPSQYGKDADVTHAYDYALAGDHHQSLDQAGLAPTVMNHRLMWHYGAPDAAKLIQADDTAKLGDLLSSDVLKKNGLNANGTVAGLKSSEQAKLWDAGLNPAHVVQFGGQPATPAGNQPAAYVPPATAKIPASQIPAPQLQEINKEEYKKLNDYRDSLNAQTNDPNYMNRISNTHAAYNLLANSKDLQNVVGRYSNADASTMMKAAMESSSMPDFISAVGRSLGSKLPTDNPKALDDLYNYLRYAGKEAMYVNNITANPTNASRQQEQHVAFGLGQTPTSALRGMMLSLHDMKLPFEQASVTNYLYDQGIPNVASLHSHDFYQYQMNEHRLRHDDLSSRKIMNRLPADIDANAFGITQYQPPSQKELNKFTGRAR
jgi:hypothetical protein